jgi:hypothetical protein
MHAAVNDVGIYPDTMLLSETDDKFIIGNQRFNSEKRLSIPEFKKLYFYKLTCKSGRMDL